MIYTERSSIKKNLQAIKNTPTYFKNLDGLRFLCFLMIFLYHSFYTEYDYIKNNELYVFLTRKVMGNGNLGVNFFFVLSGFLITYLLINERNKFNKIHIGSFWIRRILRIWPVYFICVAFGFIAFPYLKLLLGQTPSETANPWMYISFLSNFDIIRHGLPDSSVLGVLWSISIEEQFYLLWPILLLFIPIRYYWILFSGIIIGTIIFRVNFDTYMIHEYHTFSCIGDMAVGAFGSWLIITKPKFQQKITPSLLLPSVLLWSIFIFYFFFRDEYIAPIYPLRIIERFLFGILALAIILDLNYNPKTLIQFGRYKFISYLGRISYGLYAYHFIAILSVTTLTRILGLSTSIWSVLFLDTILAFILTVIIAHFSYIIIEKPFLKLKTKFAFSS